MERRDFVGAAALGLGAWAAGCGSSASAVDERPNFLFILTDQWRGDALGAAGNTFIATPNLDRLARGGVYFANAYVPQAVCTPSRASLLTGVFPTTHKLLDNVYGVPSVFADEQYELRPNYPELLRDAGYTTGYIGKWHLGEEDPGLFDYWGGYNSQKPHWIGEPYESVYRPDLETDEAIEYLEAHRDDRFFLEISYYPPHTPFRAPKRYHGRYAELGFDGWEYYAACTAIDANIGRLLNKLAELGLINNTFVIFTSDHGETFGERELSKHKRVGYEESARVPLIFHWPDGLPADTHFGGGVSTMDAMPSLLEAAGIAVPDRVEAKSRLAQIRADETGWDEPVFQQNRTQPRIDDGPHFERMVRLGDWKLMLRQARTADLELEDKLFYLPDDPGEERNRIDDPEAAAKRAELAGMIRAWGAGIGDELAVEMASRYAGK